MSSDEDVQSAVASTKPRVDYATFKYMEEGRKENEISILLHYARQRVREQGLDAHINLSTPLITQITDPEELIEVLDIRVPHFNARKCLSTKYKKHIYSTVKGCVLNVCFTLMELESRVHDEQYSEKLKFVTNTTRPILDALRGKDTLPSLAALRKSFAWDQVQRSLTYDLNTADTKQLYLQVCASGDIIRASEDIRTFIDLMFQITTAKDRRGSIAFLGYRAFFKEYLENLADQTSGRCSRTFDQCRKVATRLQDSNDLALKYRDILDECLVYWDDFPFVSDHRVQQKLMKIHDSLEESL